MTSNRSFSQHALHDSFARLHASDPVKATVDLKELLDTKFFAPLESTPLLRQLNDFITTATTDGRFEEIVRAFASSAFHLAGTNEEDTLTVKTGSSDWVVDGLDGNDSLYGGAEHDILRGGGNDRVYGKDGNDIIFGGAGNDNLRGGAGEDILDGGGGDDRLEGGDEADTLDGGAGNDRLEGGNFSADTYIFAKGHGKDVISDQGYDDEDRNTLRFADSAAADLWFTRKDYDLAIETLGTEDQVLISNWFSSANYRRFDVQSSDGKAIDNDQVAQLVSAMAAFGAGENDAAASIVEQKRAFLAGIGAAEIWQADAS